MPRPIVTSRSVRSWKGLREREREREREAEFARAYLAARASSENRCDADTEDSLHEVIARAWPRFQAGHDEVLDPGYLPKAMGNAGKNRRRSEVRETMRVARVRGAVVADPEALMIAEEALARFENALARLPVRARETFLAVDIDGASIDEVAKACDVSRKAIEMRLARARGKLRKAMAGEDETRT